MNESSCKCNSRFFFLILLPEIYPLLPTRECIINALLPGAYFFCIVWATMGTIVKLIFFCAAQFLLHSYFYYWILCCCARERCKVWCMRMKGSMCLFYQTFKKYVYLWIMAIDLVTAEIFNSCLCWSALWITFEERWSVICQFGLAEVEIFMKKCA